MMFFSSSLLFADDENEDNETQIQEHWEITEGLSTEANRVRYPLIGLSFSQPLLESLQIFSEAQLPIPLFTCFTLTLQVDKIPYN